MTDECSCGVPGSPSFEGSQEDCEVHGQRRAVPVGQRDELRAELFAAAARPGRAETRLAWVNDHCGHVLTPCGCPNSPDPEQGYLAARQAVERLTAELAAARAEQAGMGERTSRTENE